MSNGKGGIRRRDFLKRAVLGTAGLVATSCGIRLTDAGGRLIKTKDLDGVFRIAGSDQFFDPNQFDALGIPSISPSGDVPVRVWGTWSFIYEVGKGGMAQGGGLRVITPTGYVLWWSIPQADDATKPGHLEARTSNPEAQVKVSAWSPEWGSRGFSVKLVQGELRPGDRIEVTWGRGNKTQAQHTALKNIPFRFTTDLDGDGIYQECRANPTFNTLPAGFEHLRVTARTDAEVGRPHRIHVACFDKWHNLTPPAERRFIVSSDDPQADFPIMVDLKKSNATKLAFDCTFGSPGWHKITLTSAEGDIIGISHPIQVHAKMPERQIFWGDIHGHTNHSDGAGTIDEYYTYGRKAANLDICALTDHESRVGSISDIEWGMMKEAVRKYHRPGEFITFLGFEYTAMDPPKRKLGHRNVYYLGDDEPIYRFLDPRYDMYHKLWRELKKTQAMTIAHHSLVGAFAQNWDHFDPGCECLVEVYSYHGCSEYNGTPKQCGHQPTEDITGSAVVDALKRGYKLGFIGSGDGHQCQPGYGFTQETTTGYMAVMARELTREAVWEAMRARRVYATSVRGIVVEFSLNGQPMGSDLKGAGPRRLAGLVKGTAPLNYVRIIKNGEIWKEIECAGQDLVEISVEDQPPASGTGDGTDFYYLRIGQTDGHLAWSSPIWVQG